MAGARGVATSHSVRLATARPGTGRRRPDYLPRRALRAHRSSVAAAAYLGRDGGLARAGADVVRRAARLGRTPRIDGSHALHRLAFATGGFGADRPAGTRAIARSRRRSRGHRPDAERRVTPGGALVRRRGPGAFVASDPGTL